jgi:EAL domain-containing protein (putative c-di-GMP-specific phosphodiesterase class I)
MEIDVLKIGGSLVEAADRREGATMIRALVQLARTLGIWPLAERIESRRQYEILRGAGCRFGQGHFISHALPPEHVPDYVRTISLPAGYDPWVAWEASRLTATPAIV